MSSVPRPHKPWQQHGRLHYNSDSEPEVSNFNSIAWVDEPCGHIMHGVVYIFTVRELCCDSCFLSSLFSNEIGASTSLLFLELMVAVCFCVFSLPNTMGFNIGLSCFDLGTVPRSRMQECMGNNLRHAISLVTLAWVFKIRVSQW